MSNKLTIFFSIVCIGFFASFASAFEVTPVPPFDKTEWEARIVEGWNRKSLSLIRDSLSNLYLDAGVSKDEALKQAAEILSRYEKISCRYRVFWVKQFSDGRMASIKMIMELRGVPVAGGEPVSIKQTMGYTSLIFEEGQWRMYAVQFFCDPRVPGFNFDKDVGNWPDFNTQIYLKTYDPERPVASKDGWVTEFTDEDLRSDSALPAFAKAEWERRVADGWNLKDAAMILNSFSKLYNEVGVSREDAIKPVSGFFQRYDKLACRYRVLAFKRIPGTNLASVKAIMEMSGIPAGQKEYICFIQTMGYASIIFEDGQWKMFASQLFYTPRVPRFNFDSEQGNWPSWGTVVDLKP